MFKIEKTLIIVKPDAVQRGLTGNIINRFENRGFKIVASKFMQISLEVAQKHYAEHRDKNFFDAACAYLSSAPSMVMLWKGINIIELSRNMIGSTDPVQASTGSIRGDYGLTRSYNIVHGSDSTESVKYEIPLYFSRQEIIDYEMIITPWLACDD